MFAAAALVASWVLLFFQLHAWRMPLSGFLILALFFCAAGFFAAGILHRLYGISSKRWMGQALGIVASVLLYGFFLAVLIAWYHLTPFIMWVSAVACSTLLVAGYALTIQCKKSTVPYGEDEAFVRPQFHLRLIFVLLCVVGWLTVFFLLWQSRSADALL